MEEYRHKITQTEMAQAFAEWARRRQADPEGWVPLDEDTPETYGPGAAEYFLEIIEELRPGFAAPRD